MTSTIEIRETPPHRLLVKKTTCGHKEIGPAFATAIRSVGECFKTTGARMGSMPVAVYLQWRESDCDIAVGCEVEGSVNLTEGCEWLDVPGGPHAYARHYGPYDNLGETHAAIRNWCAAKGLTLSGACRETYPTDPGLEPDSSKWQTDVFYPVAG